LSQNLTFAVTARSQDTLHKMDMTKTQCTSLWVVVMIKCCKYSRTHGMHSAINNLNGHNADNSCCMTKNEKWLL